MFVQGQSGVANSLVIASNTMQSAFADGLALVVFFDEADGVTMHARIVNNTIEASERRGVTIAGSFGPSHNRVTIDVNHNTEGVSQVWMLCEINHRNSWRFNT